MAELVDALVSGTSVRKYVQVRVLFWAQNILRAAFDNDFQELPDMSFNSHRIVPDY